MHWSSGPDPLWFTCARVVVGATALLVLIRSLIELAWSVPDLWSRRVVTGEVLRTRTRWSPLPPYGNDDSGLRYFVAVDDGRATSVRAWRVPEKKYPYFYQGQQVTVTVTPLLGYVVSADPATRTPRSTGP